MPQEIVAEFADPDCESGTLLRPNVSNCPSGRASKATSEGRASRMRRAGYVNLEGLLARRCFFFRGSLGNQVHGRTDACHTDPERDRAEGTQSIGLRDLVFRRVGADFLDALALQFA